MKGALLRWGPGAGPGRGRRLTPVDSGPRAPPVSSREVKGQAGWDTQEDRLASRKRVGGRVWKNGPVEKIPRLNRPSQTTSAAEVTPDFLLACATRPAYNPQEREGKAILKIAFQGEDRA
ncbi:hypothetical protein AAFF_G00341310 [Aldrovandia affinis]|uniref:Uncharacterized protein n=1 Tax=Aldrovandia affinis TaxID=143900 RepID=A0AAD7SLA4_9TELE|nr:hypothetical protein AAFF_G00341310 [Aldrovandia affinis]